MSRGARGGACIKTKKVYPIIMRLFIGIPLPKSLLDQMAEIQKSADFKEFHLKWIPLENLHVTVKFLGEVEEKKVDAIKSVLKKEIKGGQQFSIQTTKFVPFPSKHNFRMISLNGETSEQMLELSRKIEDVLKPLGFPKEERPFVVHITLSRIKHKIDKRKLVDVLEKFSNISFENIPVDKIILYESVLTKTGAEYREVG